MELNDFQYNWYLHFEEENEKSYFGLSFDPLLEAKNYSPETIPDYVRMTRRTLKRSKIPVDVDIELLWACVVAYPLTYFYVWFSIYPSIEMIPVGLAMLWQTTVLLGMYGIEFIQSSLTSFNEITKKLHAIY
jgi:hypothetical protein